MSNKITIYDVADAAGVSLATVSRVINDSGVVNEKTRNKVQKVINDLNYVPSGVAQGLALNKSLYIALIVPETSFSFISKIITGVVDVGQFSDYNIVLHTTKFGQLEVNAVIEKVVKNRMDGVIILNSELNSSALASLMRYNIPVTIIGTKLEGLQRTSVFVDYEKATYQLVKSYLEKGINKIVFVEGDYNRFIVEDMLKGIKKAYHEFDLSFKHHLKVSDSYAPSYEEVKKYLSKEDVELIIGARDSFAIAALNAALDLNIDVPNDLEIIGFNNTKYGRMSRPTLSSVEVPLYELGARAAKLMTKLLKGEKINESHVQLETKLIKRKTTK